MFELFALNIKSEAFLGLFIIIASILATVIFALYKRNKEKKLNIVPEEGSFNKTIKAAGYAYDEKQDIFYSILDPWQRKVGYCRLYDEACAPLAMIVDCEPIYFKYDNRRWMIELWKGQYGMTCGCEVGVYVTDDIDIEIPGIYKGAFYNCVSNEDMLDISFVLKKDGKVCFKRSDKHWWLTGFKLGGFATPGELSMDVDITFKDGEMKDAFIAGLLDAGYNKKEFSSLKNKVSLQFDIPRSTPPSTRNEDIDMYFLERNKSLCDMYHKITDPYDNYQDKFNALKNESNELYDNMSSVGRPKDVFNFYVVICNYLN